MRKVFLMAMVAIAFIACNGNGGINGSTAPAKDQKALTSVTTEGVNLIGKDAASVDKTLKDAGFKQMEVEEDLAPARKMKALKASDDGFEYVYYSYNMPENADKMTGEEAIKYMDNLLTSGEFYISVAVAVLANGKVAAVETSLMTGVNDKVNLTYTDISDKLYKSLPSNAEKHWRGVISVDEERKTYEKQEEYVAAIAKANAVQAEEQGNALTSVSETSASGLLYYCMWFKPTDERAAEMKKSEGFAFTFGQFAVADFATSNNFPTSDNQ